MAKCLENKIAIYSPHTAWDAVFGGVTDWLTDAFSKYSNISKYFVELIVFLNNAQLSKRTRTCL